MNNLPFQWFIGISSEYCIKVQYGKTTNVLQINYKYFSSRIKIRNESNEKENWIACGSYCTSRISGTNILRIEYGPQS